MFVVNSSLMIKSVLVKFIGLVGDSFSKESLKYILSGYCP